MSHRRHYVTTLICVYGLYTVAVPKLWTETVAAHRAAVREATLDTTAALVAEHGLASVTMSRIAAETGIGRATLYKYFPDVEAILLAWHERQIDTHLAQLAEIAQRPTGPGDRLEAVCHAYAHIHYQTRTAHTGPLAAWLHQDEHVARAYQRLRTFLTELLAQAATAGQARADIEPGELADYCLHALTAARDAQSPDAVERLVSITLAGLRRDNSSGPTPGNARP